MTITITATINAGTQGSIVSNQGTVAFDADANGNNESTVLTDDPSLPGASDPTSFTVNGALVTAAKTASGKFNVYSTVTYTMVLTNSGNVASTDNTGNELVDIIPSDLTLVDATVTGGGTVATNLGTNTVTWNGGIGAGASVTITVHATVNTNTEFHTVSNQANISYDASESGSNNTSGLSNDPGTPAANDPTSLVVIDLIFADGFEP